MDSEHAEVAARCSWCGTTFPIFKCGVRHCIECGAGMPDCGNQSCDTCGSEGPESLEEWDIYEAKKVELQNAGLTPERYEQAVRQLAYELGV